MPERLAVCRLAPEADAASLLARLLPGRGFVALCRTGEELSVVCPEAVAPNGATVQAGFLALKVEGPLDFGLTGVLASLAEPLAGARISIFAISTYDTDYILVRRDDLDRAVSALAQAGHEVA